MIKTLILLLALCGSVQAAPLVQPQDISAVTTSTFSFQGAVSVGTNTNSTALTVYGVITSSTPLPTVSCTASDPWTITCNPVAGVGWTHEAILYRVGK